MATEGTTTGLRFDVRRMTRRDLAAAAQTLARAFQTDPMYNFAVPDDRQRQRWLPVFKREILRNAVCFGESYAAVDDAGNVLGVIGLTPPGKYPHSWWSDTRLIVNAVLFPTPWCPTLSKAWVLKRYAETFDAMHYRGRHWYVDTFGVDPAWQSRGIGRRLMQRTIELAAGDRLPIWLETQTEANVGYYEGFGFRVIHQKHPAPGGPPTWGMLRTAASIES